MSNDFGTGKSILVLGVVAGCFAILWPNVFYPMITGSYTVQKNEGYSGGCCDVIFDNDINAIRIISGLCEKILASDTSLDPKSLMSFEEGKLTREILTKCQTAVLDKCNLNITDIIRRNALLGKSYRQNLDLIRTLNSSICLRESFGIPVGQIGLPRRIRVWGVNMSKHLKQERPPHLHPDMMHPALREKGRAIPQSHIVPKIVQEGRPGPLPGMRPPMGGPGHVVPPPKVGTGGTMGIVMPMYTIGIVVFFLYTIMKLLFKKPSESSNFDDFSSDPNFREQVFTANTYSLSSSKDKNIDEPTRLVVTAITGLVQQVNKETSSEQTAEVFHSQDSSPSSAEATASAPVESEVKNEEASKNEADEEVNRGIKVVGMETTESCEGSKWTQPVPRPPTPQATPRPPTPQNIYLPGVISDQSQLLVTDSTTEALPDSENEVVLSGKVTLSLIGIQDSDEAMEKPVEATATNLETETDEDSVDLQRVPDSGDECSLGEHDADAGIAISDDIFSGCEEDHESRNSPHESDNEIQHDDKELDNEFFDIQETELTE